MKGVTKIEKIQIFKSKLRNIIKYKKSIFKRKYYSYGNYIFKFMQYTFAAAFSLGIISFVFYKIYILTFHPIKISFNNFNLNNNYFDFLWSQISVSFISTTIISLLSVFSSTYLYGSKLIDIMYKKNSFFSMLFSFIILFLLIIGSIVCCFIPQKNYYIFLNFMITLIIVFFLFTKIILFYSYPEFFKYSLKVAYLNEEKNI